MEPSFTELLARYATEHEALLTHQRLAGVGIASSVEGTDPNLAFGMGGAPTPRGVRVMVDADDLERAVETLAEDEAATTRRGTWVCPRCDETNDPAFELCWNCGKPFGEPLSDGEVVVRTPGVRAPGVGDPSPPPTTPVQPSVSIRDDGNPYRPVSTPMERAGSSIGGRATKNPADESFDRHVAHLRRRLTGAVVLSTLMCAFPVIGSLLAGGVLAWIGSEATRPAVRRRIGGSLTMLASAQTIVLLASLALMLAYL